MNRAGCNRAAKVEMRRRKGFIGRRRSFLSYAGCARRMTGALDAARDAASWPAVIWPALFPIGPALSLGLLAQKDVARTFAGDRPRAFVAQRTHVDAVQQVLSGTE